MTLKAHPFADLFPLMTPSEHGELRSSMLKQGYDHNAPIVLYKGMILDGRNRYAVATELKIEPSYRDLTDAGSDDDALAYVLRHNLARRHLSTSQRAMVAARLVTSRRGKQALGNGPVITQFLAASKMGVSERSVRAAIKLISEDPAAADKVVSGQGRVNKPRVAPKAKPHVAANSGNDEWYTPPDFMRLVRTALGEVDCDPCTSNEAQGIVRAASWATEKENGLSDKCKWVGRVYLNPPYSDPEPWIAKLLASAKTVTEAIVLVNNATETRWGQKLLSHADAIIFVRGRVQFWRPGQEPSKGNGTPLQGQMVAYFGPNPQRFLFAFAPAGVGVLAGSKRTVSALVGDEPANLPVQAPRKRVRNGKAVQA